MPDYKTMYYKLFNSVTDVIEISQDVQQITEGIYIKSGAEATGAETGPVIASEARQSRNE